MATYKKKRRSRNYKRRKYTRRLRNIRRSKRFIQKAGVFGLSGARVAPLHTPLTDKEKDRNIEDTRETLKEQIFKTIQYIRDKYVYMSDTKLEEQDLERLKRTFQEFFEYIIGTAKMANLQANRDYITPIKPRIDALNTETKISEVIELCNTIETNIRLAYPIKSN